MLRIGVLFTLLIVAAFALNVALIYVAVLIVKAVLGLGG